jgi:hypothetical protein
MVGSWVIRNSKLPGGMKPHHWMLRARTTGHRVPSTSCDFYTKHPDMAMRPWPRRLTRRRHVLVLQEEIDSETTVVWHRCQPTTPPSDQLRTARVTSNGWRQNRLHTGQRSELLRRRRGPRGTAAPLRLRWWVVVRRRSELEGTCDG